MYFYLQEPDVDSVTSEKKASLVAMSFSKDEVEFAMNELGRWKFLSIDAEEEGSKFHAFLFTVKSNNVSKFDFSDLLLVAYAFI